MKVEAVMAAKGREVATIHPTATLATVAQRLRLQNIGALVVLEADRLAGMISERDVVHAFAAHRGEAAEIQVADVMTPLAETLIVSPSSPMNEVIERMSENETRRVIVAQDWELRGIITGGDVANWLDRAGLVGS